MHETFPMMEAWRVNATTLKMHRKADICCVWPFGHDTYLFGNSWNK
jgi:hypothetical protein